MIQIILFILLFFISFMFYTELFIKWLEFDSIRDCLEDSDGIGGLMVFVFTLPTTMIFYVSMQRFINWLVV